MWDDLIAWQYSYFVSYWAMSDADHTGYGRIEYNTDRPITGANRIEEIENKILELNPILKRVIVLHWVRFEV